MANGSEGGRVTRSLHHHRFRIVLWVAVAEALIALLTHGLHIWTIIVLAAIAFVSLMIHNFMRERTHSPFLHQLTWLLAASQLGATVAVTAGYILTTALVIIIVIFALVALGLLLLERR